MIPRQIKPGTLKLTIRGTKTTLALSLFLLAAKKMAIILSLVCRFGRTAQFLTAACTAGAAALCKVVIGRSRSISPR